MVRTPCLIPLAQPVEVVLFFTDPLEYHTFGRPPNNKHKSVATTAEQEEQQCRVGTGSWSCWAEENSGALCRRTSEHAAPAIPRTTGFDHSQRLVTVPRARSFMLCEAHPSFFPLFLNYFCFFCFLLILAVLSI